MPRTTVGMLLLVILAVVLEPGRTAAYAQVWTESGDAPSFPDGAAQVTRGG